MGDSLCTQEKTFMQVSSLYLNNSNLKAQGLISIANYVLHLIVILYSLGSLVIKRISGSKVCSLNIFFFNVKNNTLNLI